MQSSLDRPSNSTSLTLKIPSQEHSLSIKPLFKLTELLSHHPKNQAIINLIPQGNPNSHSSSPLTQDQDQASSDSSELALDDENSQNGSEIDEAIHPSPVKGLSNSTLNPINDQTGDTTKAFRQLLAGLDNMEEEEKLLCPEDPQIPDKQQGEAEAQSLRIEAQKEQDKQNPLENYQKVRNSGEMLRGIENPEDIEDEVFKSFRKGSKGLETLEEKVKTRKTIEAEMALELLENFDLGKLKISKRNVPDMRYSESKEYKRLCESARLDHEEHFKKNIMRFSQKSEGGKSTQAGSNDNMDNKEIKGSQRGYISEEILAKIEEAKRKVKEYDVSKVVFKKDKTADGRFKKNRKYILLLEQCELSYYLKN